MVVGRGPASSSKTEMLGFSLSRLATTHPPGPEPTTIKSYSECRSPGAVMGLLLFCYLNYFNLITSYLILL